VGFFRVTHSIAFVRLIHPEVTHRVSIVPLITKGKQFSVNPELLGASYHIRSRVPATALQSFVAALEDKEVDITDTNYWYFSLFCDEFGFDGLAL
jgi:hypothetical protein